MKNDYANFDASTIDVAAMTAKISAGGGMATQIRTFLDQCDGCIQKNCPPHRALRKALSKWNNLSMEGDQP